MEFCPDYQIVVGGMRYRQNTSKNGSDSSIQYKLRDIKKGDFCFMKHILLIAFILASSIQVPAQNKKPAMQQNTINEEGAVLATVRQLGQLMVARDTASMNNILDEHYTLTHMTGYVQPKLEWFGEVQKETMKYYSAKEVDHQVTLNGIKADVTVKNMVDARIWGSRNTWRLQQQMKLEKRNGKWIILQSIASTF
ncbi:nuclear transport factor 2 family protein [Dyadobacter sp. CY107]|uniref:nuclear transport factor 2 family protein n=1 Tax=Dyadobacter fanqingshengii TaxID=2906443 RepID=UPI001F3517D3|nr:nuclear transport factor 2 family protein [Dyadobacter fanqingshengii]MCF2505298.1 nuclear transport factor 2 family protein [Dyadobacter fanqingshengii]